MDVPQYISRFEQFGFGLFLHWGLYSQVRQGEWYWNYHKPSKEEYVKLVDGFTAEDFDADALVKWAKGNGVNYICLTTRHHEGFSLYDTQGLNTYDAPHSQLVATWSKNLPMPVTSTTWVNSSTTPLSTGGTLNSTVIGTYQQYLRDSVKILCSNYGKVDGLWFDGNWARRDRDRQEDALNNLIRELQPEFIIVNNSSIGAVGAEGHPMTDVITFEQGDAAAKDQTSRYRALEVCDTMNSHWGVGDFDLSYHSPAAVVQRLVNCRKFGANLLMNIGPTAQGAIPATSKPPSTSWVGGLIFVLRPSPQRALELQARGDNFVLRDGKTYYFFCHNIEIHGNGHLLRGEKGTGWHAISGELAKVSSARWADNDEALDFEQQGEVLNLKATPYPYGRQLGVRIAIIETE